MLIVNAEVRPHFIQLAQNVEQTRNMPIQQVVQQPIIHEAPIMRNSVVH